MLVVLRSPTMHHVADYPETELPCHVPDRHRFAYVLAIREQQNEIPFATL